MTITKIERQKNNPKRVNVYCNGEFVAGIHEEVLTTFGLREGDTLDEQQLRHVQSAEEIHLAREKALRYISYRMRSEKEVRAKLLEQEFHPSVVDKVTASLKDLGVLNDRKFAEAYIHDVMMKKPSGVALIRLELRRKGVEKSIVEDALASFIGTETQTALAREAARKHMRRSRMSRKKVELPKQQKRLSDFLARRGFSWETIKSVMKEFFPQQNES